MNTPIIEEGRLSSSLRVIRNVPTIRRPSVEENRGPSLVNPQGGLLGEVVRIHDRVSHITICIWKLELHLVSDVYLLLKRVCSVMVFDAIIQIRRICQRDDRIRFEVDIPGVSSATFLAQIQAARHRFAWLVRIKERSDRVRLAKNRLSPNVDLKPLRLCSLNINGLRGKRTDLEDYLATCGIDIIGLQETRRKADHWRFHMLGYNVVEVTSTAGPGQRGLAIAVKEGISSFPVGPKSQYFIFLRVFGRNVAKPFIVGTIYLPHRHANVGVPGLEPPHVQARLDLISAIGRIRISYPTDLITVMGDFNRNIEEMRSLLRHLPGFYLPILTDSDATVGTRNGRVIDHFLVSTKDKDLLQDITVDDTLDLSDHWPLLASLHYRTAGNNDAVDGRTETCKWMVPRKSNTRALAQFYRSNRFDALLEELDDEATNAEANGDILGGAIPRLANGEDDNVSENAEDLGAKLSRRVREFIASCNQIGQDLRWVKKSTKKAGGTHPTTKQHQSACRERRILYCEFRALKRHGARGGHLAPTPEEIEAAFHAYHLFRKNTNALAKKARSERWAKVLVQADKDRTSNPREFWSWLTTTSSWKRKDSSFTLQPMRDAQGILQTEGAAIRRVWQDHYEGLAADVTGHSQSAEFWAAQLPAPPIMASTLDELNADIHQTEVGDALSELKNNKAPGMDHIPVEFFKLFVTPVVVDAELEQVDTSRPIRVLTLILQEMWTQSYVPDSLNMAALVSIFKKEDPTLAGNYRGISLIDSLVKILISLLTSRLQRRLEAKNLFIQGQGGFRTHEESVSQALALYEIIKRRQNTGQDTYALFLDYQKAFDTVPHEGLFRKMDLLGIRGRMLQFVKALYKNSRVVVRANDGSLSESFPLKRGVRQGCPMSPVLFLIYINDMFVECNEGASVPVTHKNNISTYLASGIAGLLFADDAVALANTTLELESLLRKICVWSARMELSFGISKCGLMHFTIDPLAPSQDTIFQDKTIWQIDGAAIPVVNNYTYLGLDFFRNSCLKKMCQARTEKGRKTLFHFKPFLTCPSIPIFAKLRILYSIVMPTMLYGSEVWGLKNDRGMPQERLINRALRWILDFKGPIQLLSVGAMHAELSITPFMAQMAARRVRGYLKFPTLNTWIAEIMKAPLRLRSKNWQTTTEQWLNRYLKANVGKSRYRAAPGSPAFGSKLKETLEATRVTVTQQCVKRWKIHAPHLPSYYDAYYQSLLELKQWVPFFGKGLLLIMLVRGNGYWVQKRIDDCGPPHERRNCCPFCHSATPETAVHLMFHCAQWNLIRERYISGVIEACKTTLRAAEIVPIEGAVTLTGLIGELALRLILGGEVAGGARLDNWMGTDVIPQGNNHATACFDDADEGVWQQHPCYRVAGFLFLVDAERSKRYQATLDGADHIVWPPVLPNGQGPQG